MEGSRLEHEVLIPEISLSTLLRDRLLTQFTGVIVEKQTLKTNNMKKE
jgi:hypothetical protein